MISNQILQSTIDGLKTITRIDICVLDTEGKVLASTIPNAEVYENAGFESQRTFNRFFTEKLHMSPREYRKTFRQEVEKSSEELFASTRGIYL